MNDPIQPADFTFDEASEAEIPRIIARYPEGRQASAVMPLLHLVQRQMGRTTGHAWVPTAAMNVVADRLSMPRIRVYEVATFYTMFHLKPVQKFHLQVCTTTPCWLRGSDAVLEACRKAVAADGDIFSMEEFECVGACVNAPVLVINDDYYEDLDGPRTETVLSACRNGTPPPYGSTIGRQGSAPEGGRTTLFASPTPPEVTSQDTGAEP